MTTRFVSVHGGSDVDSTPADPGGMIVGGGSPGSAIEPLLRDAKGES